MLGFDSLRNAINSGLRAYESGELEIATAAFRRATIIAPDHPGAHNLLGVALLSARQLPDALIELEHAVRLAKNDAPILGNLAQAYAAAGRHAEAQQTFEKAGRIDPRNPQYSQGTAIALAQQGRVAEAITLLQRLITRFPGNASLWYNLGNAHRAQQNWTEAERCYREASKFVPADPETHNNLGSVLHSQLRFTDAAAAYRACIAIQPGHVAAHLNLVSALIDDGQFAAAEEACTILLALAPDLPEAHRFLAAALSHQGKVAAALPEYAQAASLAPNDFVSQRSYGGALAEAGCLHQALNTLNRLPDSERNTDALRQLQSSLFLASGLYAQGWSAYRRRPAFLRFKEKLDSETLTQELPTDLAGKHVAVLREQGLGDELFFLRYLPALKALGAQVTLRISERIAAMLARTNYADQIVSAATIPVTADFQILCGDLPHALGTYPNSPFEATSDKKRFRIYAICIRTFYPPLPQSIRIPVLTNVAADIRKRLLSAGSPPYLGITWRAGTAARDQDDANWALSKEVPLQLLAQCLRGFPGTLLALQRKPVDGEIRAFAALCGTHVHDFTDLNDDLEQMLALLSLIDEYIGVSNTNMHLRAATGRSARVLVPNPPEWRWFASGRSSPWFPDFVLYRQSLGGGWDSLSELSADLHQSADATRPHPN